MKIAIDKRIFSNSAWMMLEKFLGIFGLIFVNSYMAKYIGPENFGKLAFTTSIFVFVQTLSWFGAQNILFKRFSENTQSGIRLAITTQSMRCYIYILTSFCALLYLWFSSDSLTFIFGIGNCIASYFIINDIYSIHNNSQLISIVNALTNTIGLFLALALRFILVFFEVDPYTMIFPIIILAMIPYILRKIYFYKNFSTNRNIKSKKRYNKYMLVTGGSLVLSSLSIVLYTQISNIFLAKFTSFTNLGIYNVALTLGSAWGFINIALITSYFSKIYGENDNSIELQYLRQIHWLVIVVSLFVMMGIFLIGSWVVNTLYGADFIESIKLLPIVALATMFSALGTISYRYMIKLNGYKYLSIKMIGVGMLSVPLSYIFIQYYGIWGAAICFVLIEFLSLTLANYFFKKQVILKLHLSVIGLKNG
ncbi:oligosaccharide flippase family protein [Acinetobacter sp. 230853]|uniref:oligosaccharide flippase family protein n=1 Tax=Acinetobacter sp. 230853 TaxID=1310651 RepID=UPI00044D35F2|nr:oligosaccharide flippase family protein [Acinetobacter sp. 230853]EXB72347.1 polysaccharide biosynthesis family protein [Acinetobacter sp. 230853]